MTQIGHQLVAFATTAAVALSALAMPVLAQEITASEFTTENVVAQSPFAGLPIDRNLIDRNLANFGAFLVRFSDAQLTELQQRCVVISGNAGMYDDPSVRLCNAVLAAAEDAAGM